MLNVMGEIFVVCATGASYWEIILPKTIVVREPVVKNILVINVPIIA